MKYDAIEGAMWGTLIAGLFAAGFLSGMSACHGMTIRNNQGGQIGAHYLNVVQAMDSGEQVAIDGLCASACTLHLMNPNACATPRAKLVFHAASNSAGTEFLMSHYPAKVRALINARGGLSSKLITVNGNDAIKLIGKC